MLFYNSFICLLGLLLRWERVHYFLCSRMCCMFWGRRLYLTVWKEIPPVTGWVWKQWSCLPKLLMFGSKLWLEPGLVLCCCLRMLQAVLALLELSEGLALGWRLLAEEKGHFGISCQGTKKKHKWEGNWGKNALYLCYLPTSSGCFDFFRLFQHQLLSILNLLTQKTQSPAIAGLLSSQRSQNEV